MAGVLVGYDRFIEVQQRRARIVEELVPAVAGDTPEATTADNVVVSQHADRSGAQGAVDARQRERSTRSSQLSWPAEIAPSVV
jgi:hypothetical protein